MWWTEAWIVAFWVNNGQIKSRTEPKALPLTDFTYPGLAELTSRLQFPVWLVFLFIKNNLGEWISSCVFYWYWFTYIRKRLCKSISKAEMDHKASEASEMELLLAEVSGWKMLTIDVEGFFLGAMWSLDSPLNKNLRFWNFL